MKKLVLLSAVFGFLCVQAVAADTPAPSASASSQVSSSTGSASAAAPSSFANMTDQTSYVLGLTLGNNIKSEGINISVDTFAKGFATGYNGAKPLLSDQEIKNTMMALQQQLLAKQKKEEASMADANEAAGEKFLDDNKSSTGIVSLPDGLQYKVIKEGTGDTPTKQDTVTVDYEASTIDGKVFDSSYKRGKPADFKVSDMIRGFQEALLLMKPGATWQVYIPAALAYGAQGVPGVIGPNQVLVFKIHLISIDKAADTASSNTSDNS